MELGAILNGRQNLGLEDGDLLGVQSDPLQFLMAVQADQGMWKPTLEVVVSGLLAIVAGVREETMAQQQATAYNLRSCVAPASSAQSAGGGVEGQVMR